MAHIVIFVTSVTHDAGSGNCKATGEARLSSDGGMVDWEYLFPYNQLAATINDGIRDAAIASAEAASYTVGALDKKTLVASAVGL